MNEGAEIAKPIRWVKRDDHAIVYVQLTDGSEAEIFIGGAVEHYYHHGKSKAFVMKGRPKQSRKPKA